jgi:hypothetical protein
MTPWDAMLANVAKPAKDPNEAVRHAQIRDRLFNLKQLKERVQWLERNAGDPVIASALLTAPPFLSGLTEPELALVRGKIEKLALSPEMIEVRAKTMQAWQQVEAGQKAARHKIAERAGARIKQPYFKTTPASKLAKQATGKEPSNAPAPIWVET